MCLCLTWCACVVGDLVSRGCGGSERGDCRCLRLEWDWVELGSEGFLGDFTTLQEFGPRVGLKISCTVAYRVLVFSSIKLMIFISILKTGVALDMGANIVASRLIRCYRRAQQGQRAGDLCFGSHWHC